MKRAIKISAIVFVIFIFTSATFGSGIGVGWYARSLSAPPVVQASDQPAEFNIFWQAWYLVQHNFVDRASLDPTQLTYGAIRGMLDALGDEGHTTFMAPDDFKRQQTDISGKFTGIGAQLGIKDGLPRIVSPFDGSPAATAGIKAGDIILEVNHEDVTTWSLEEIVNAIRGEAGTEVVITVIRPDESESLEIAITRGEINIPAVSWTMVADSDIAMIRLSQFNANATDELVSAIKQAKENGTKGIMVLWDLMWWSDKACFVYGFYKGKASFALQYPLSSQRTGIILDLRNNPGGLLQQAIGVTSQFLSDGLVLQQEDANGKRQTYPVKRGGVASDMPLVVLTNRGTASSAEILAGAIQDHTRGPVVGETTFGTGTILEPFTLEDGSALLLGTGQWLTANGRLIRKQGIKPDIEIELPIGTEFLYPENMKELTLDEILHSEDTQVLKALELLEPALVATEETPEQS